MQVELCPTCGRARWPGGHGITIAECVAQGDDICQLIEQRNSLVAALRNLLGKPSIEAQRTSRAILEHYVPMDNVCPVCTQTVSLNPDRMIRVHFQSGLHNRPCPGSYKTA